MTDDRLSGRRASAVKTIAGERGAALMSALLAAVFLTVLGLVVLEVLKAGLTQAASTESSIRAEALAQRGIDDVTALVWDAVKSVNENPSPAYAYDRKVKDIDAKLDLLADRFAGGLTVQGLQGAYTIGIASDVSNFDDFIAQHAAIPDYPYSRILTVRSEAAAGRRTAVKQAGIYVTTINPVFNYPLSAKRDLVLSGAPFIVGDVLAREGKMVVFNKAYFTGSPGRQHAWEADWPTVKGFYRAQVVERGDMQGGEPIAPDGIRFSHFEPFADEQLPKDADIPIPSAVAARMAEMNAALADPMLFQPIEDEAFGGHVIAANVPIGKKYTGGWVSITDGEIAVGDGSSVAGLAVDDGVLAMSPGSRVTLPNGPLYVRYDNDFVAAATFAGFLEVAPPHAVVVKGDAVIEDGFRFKGAMFVDGSVQIVGSVNLEGALYVSGAVDMKDMRSINFPDDDGDGIADEESAPLILMAGGPVIFSESKSSAPIRIRAYLYSLQPVKLYGVVSKFHITGGVHGEDVVLNALREDPDHMNAYWIDPDLGEPFLLTPPDKQPGLPPERSNLQIFHDPALFSDPPVGIPVTDHLTMFARNA